MYKDLGTLGFESHYIFRNLDVNLPSSISYVRKDLFPTQLELS